MKRKQNSYSVCQIVPEEPYVISKPFMWYIVLHMHAYMHGIRASSAIKNELYRVLKAVSFYITSRE